MAASAMPDPTMSTLPARQSFLAASGDRTLVEQIVGWHAARIDERLLRPGMRLASIRRFSVEHHVSRFTVVEAYDRLVALGLVESRRGSGFFVRERPAGDARGRVADTPDGAAGTRPEPPPIDVAWLVRNMFRDLPPQDMPGGGTLPPDWLDGPLVAGALRAVARGHPAPLLDYGSPQGWLPLRQQLSLRLAGLDIAAGPEQILTTNGVTQGLDLVAQHFLRAGDAVLVDDPSWFVMFGRFALLGLRVVGVPRLADGPDLSRLRDVAAEYRPKLFVISSVLHNPTGTGLSAAKAFQVLRLAEEFDFRIVEDDIYCDLHPGPTAAPTVRLAALDQLSRVIYLGGFSKVLAPNLRVGFVACDSPLARGLTDLKALVGLTGSEIGERTVYKVLRDGHYRRHLHRLRQRLSEARPRALEALEALGLTPFDPASAGMFAWVDAGVDTAPVARAMLESGFLLAPGSLFLPDQRASTWMRFNVACTGNPRMLTALGRTLDAVRRRQALKNPRPSPRPAPVARAAAPESTTATPDTFDASDMSSTNHTPTITSTSKTQ